MIDFVINNNKLASGDGLENEVKDILTARAGHFKFFPNIGVGINDFIDEKVGDQTLFSIVSVALKKDGKRLKDAGTIGDIYVTKVERS